MRGGGRNSHVLTWEDPDGAGSCAKSICGQHHAENLSSGWPDVSGIVAISSGNSADDHIISRRGRIVENTTRYAISRNLCIARRSGSAYDDTEHTTGIRGRRRDGSGWVASQFG